MPFAIFVSSPAVLSTYFNEYVYAYYGKDDYQNTCVQKSLQLSPPLRQGALFKCRGRCTFQNSYSPSSGLAMGRGFGYMNKIVLESLHVSVPCRGIPCRCHPHVMRSKSLIMPVD